MAEPLHYLKVNNNFTQEALDFLISQFKGKENVEKLLEFLVFSEDEFHKLLISVGENFLIDIARTWFLDQIGEQYGVDREGQSDDEYRGRIKALAKLYSYTGTWEDTKRLFDNLLGTPVVIGFTNPGTINIVASDVFVEKIKNTSVFDRLIPAGMFLRVIALADTPFLCSSVGDTPNTLGCSSTSDATPTGGLVNSLYYSSL